MCVCVCTPFSICVYMCVHACMCVCVYDSMNVGVGGAGPTSYSLADT